METPVGDAEPVQQNSVEDFAARIKAHMAGGQQSLASEVAVKALMAHPTSQALQSIYDEVQASVKWFPRFRDTLVKVSLATPPSATIGDSVKVSYSYCHKTPQVKYKEYLPLSQQVQNKLTEHDEIVMRNSKLPTHRVAEVVTSAAKVRALHAPSPKVTSSDKSPHKEASNDASGRATELGTGWSEEERKVLQGVLDDLIAGVPFNMMEASEDAKYELTQQLSIDRGIEDITAMLRLMRLYSDAKALEHIGLTDSNQAHKPNDWIALVRVDSSMRENDKSTRTSPLQFSRHRSPETKRASPTDSKLKISREPSQHSPIQSFTSLGERKSKSPTASPRNRRRVSVFGLKGGGGAQGDSSRPMSKFSDGEGSPHDAAADYVLPRGKSEMALQKVQDNIVQRCDVPPEDTGEVEFSDGSLEIGTYQFRYFMHGSMTPVCTSAPFSTNMPTATLEAPQQAVTSGEASTIKYSIALNRAHSPKDWIGIYPQDSYGPSGCAIVLPVPEPNEGEIVLAKPPAFPGRYYARYHLGQHGDLVAATSDTFEVRIKQLPRAASGREVRIFLCSTVADMLDERRVLVDEVVPRLQAKLESQHLTVSLITFSWGMRDPGDGSITEEASASEDHLRVILHELERCRPYFVAVVGERYGWIPEEYPPDLLDAYPWLGKYTKENEMLPGVRASVLEIQVLNGFLVQPDAAEQNAFFFREASYARRAGIPSHTRGKYEPVSEYGREALNNLKDEIRRQPSAVVHNFPNATALGQQVFDHLSQAILLEFPQEPVPLSPVRRINLATEMHLVALLDAQSKHHPHLDDVPSLAPELLDSATPTYFRGGPGTGKTSILASCIQQHLQTLSEDPDVEWESGEAPVLGEGRLASVYRRNNHRRLILVQVVGLQETVCSEADLLHHAMTQTKEALGLRMDVPWDPDALADLLPSWLEEVTSLCVFTWVIDGLDQLLGAVPTEAVYIPAAPSMDTARSPVNMKTSNKIERQEPLEQIEEKERVKLLALKSTAQLQIAEWLVPLMDERSEEYAPLRYPNLRLLIIGMGEDGDGQRPMPRELVEILEQATNLSLKVVDVQLWTWDKRSLFVQDALQAVKVSASAARAELIRAFVLKETHKPDKVAKGGEPEAGEPASTQTPDLEVTANSFFLSQLVLYVASLNHPAYDDAAVERALAGLHACDSSDKLAAKIVRGLSEFPLVESAFRFLHVTRMGLRENELWCLLSRLAVVTGEDLVLVLELLSPVTVKNLGLIQLRPRIKAAASVVFQSFSNRSETLQHMAAVFTSLGNAEREAHEMPWLLLRLGHVPKLAEYITTQSALHFLGKRSIMRFIRAAGLAHDASAHALKKNLESAFGIEGALWGRKYELTKLLDVTRLLNIPGHEDEEAEMNSREMLPSARRNLQHQFRVDVFTRRTLDMVEMICCLDPAVVEIAEGLLESAVKMLHGADSLLKVAERATKYPQASLDIMAEFAVVFHRALSVLSVLEQAPSTRAELMRSQQQRAVQDLIGTKVKILLKGVAAIAKASEVPKAAGVSPNMGSLSLTSVKRLSPFAASSQKPAASSPPKFLSSAPGSPVDEEEGAGREMSIIHHAALVERSLKRLLQEVILAIQEDKTATQR